MPKTFASDEERKAYFRERRRAQRADPEKRAAYNEYMSDLRRKPPVVSPDDEKEENPNDPRIPAPHGTAARYSRGGCRCPRCTAANTETMQKYRHNKRMLHEDPGA